LSIEDHAEAHRLLWEKHGHWQDKVAWCALSGHIGKEEIIHEIHKNMNKGRIPSDETREKMSAAKRGRKITKEHAEKLHAGRRKSKNSPEHIEALKISNIGRKHTEETKKKISESRAGIKISNVGKQNMSASSKKRFSDPIKRQQFAERMQQWWDERRKVGT
jgi:hypothetical protein